MGNGVASWLAATSCLVAAATSSSGMHGKLKLGASAPDDFFRFMEPRDTSVMLWICSRCPITNQLGKEFKGQQTAAEENMSGDTPFIFGWRIAAVLRYLYFMFCPVWMFEIQYIFSCVVAPNILKRCKHFLVVMFYMRAISIDFNLIIIILHLDTTTQFDHAQVVHLSLQWWNVIKVHCT